MHKRPVVLVTPTDRGGTKIPFILMKLSLHSIFQKKYLAVSLIMYKVYRELSCNCVASPTQWFGPPFIWDNIMEYLFFNSALSEYWNSKLLRQLSNQTLDSCKFSKEKIIRWTFCVNLVKLFFSFFSSLVSFSEWNFSVGGVWFSWSFLVFFSVDLLFFTTYLSWKYFRSNYKFQHL